MKVLTLKNLGGIESAKIRREKCITSDHKFEFVAAIRACFKNGLELDILLDGSCALVDRKGLHGFHSLTMNKNTAWSIWEKAGGFES